MEENVYHLYLRGLISRIYKDLKKLNTQTTKIPDQQVGKSIENAFHKKRYTNVQEICEKCPKTLAIREMQFKIALRFPFTLVRMAIIKNTRNNKSWPGCGEKLYLYIGLKLLICAITPESSMEIPQKPWNDSTT